MKSTVSTPSASVSRADEERDSDFWHAKMVSNTPWTIEEHQKYDAYLLAWENKEFEDAYWSDRDD